MSKQKYVLIIINEEEQEYMKEPKEVRILKKVSSGTIRGASCGSLNICVFFSDYDRNDISKMLQKDKLKFFIFNEEDSTYSIPKRIADMFGANFERDPDPEGPDSEHLADFTDEDVKPKKLSLDEQLKVALKNEEFEMASILRDKIARDKANPKKAEKKSSDGATLKTLFEE
jgi:hypothetical protein